MWSFPNTNQPTKEIEYQYPAIIETPIDDAQDNKKTITWKFPSFPKKDEYYRIEAVREPVTTFCITPNNSPEVRYDSGYPNRSRNGFNEHMSNNGKNNRNETDLILNTIHGLFQNFYPPERIRFDKDELRIKMNDVVSFKVGIEDGVMKFYLTVPKKWSKNFISAIRQDWGQVDITEVDNRVVDFDRTKAQAMEVHLRHHYALSLKHDKFQNDSFLSSISSLASTMSKGDKLLIDYNIEPTNDSWKNKANNKMRLFKSGKVASRDDTFTLGGVLGKVFDMFNVILDEFVLAIEEIMGAEKEKGKAKKEEQLFDLRYSDEKLHANSKGYKVQIRVIGQSEDEKKVKHAFRNLETSYGLLDGDNKYTVTNVKSKKRIEKLINAVEKNEPLLGKTTDVYFEKELKNIIKLPSKETLKEYNKVIIQDSFTRTEIDDDFFRDEDGAIPFGYTLDKEPKKLFMGGYKRGDWSEKGRYVKDKQALDDKSTSVLCFGGMGSGKTSLSENQALYTFGAHLTDKEQWKRESKSVVVFDVADGAMIKNIYNHVPDWQKDRVIVLNHSNFKNPIAVNNADLAEFNTEVMQDDDYSYTLAEMESKLVLEILGSDKTISMDRWFTSSLQAVKAVNKDWGYIEAMRVLTDDDFRQEEVLPHLTNKRLQLELKSYNQLAMNGSAKSIIETIQNRFSQLERDQKLWDCIAQKPIRNEDGKVKLNFRQMMDGDEDGAYMILIYIPKSGVSQMYRKFIFAHYFTKVWNVLLSREVGFGGREYRPETLIIVDEVHQIIDIPIIGKLFIDIFKENRKYSGKFFMSLHGWSSLAKAGRGLEGDIKQSILDNGANLIFLRGGADAFKSLNSFLYPMTPEDFDNLMNMDYCGIFAIRWKNKNHVLQARMLTSVDNKDSDFTRYRNVDSDFLTEYCSPYGLNREEVRDDNLNRSYKMIEQSIMSGFEQGKVGDDTWSEIENIGMKEPRSKK
ncbi:type IV secretory system conjugative DNA transfer family protein [Bacillus sp. FJAT-22090]|uniref:type IV secretory system conjugative DNA transfer family protein n=1 Tax=Bacillus sp. FJAT-22090 TaxID=1581038 RepID=UPI0016427C22|nr:type IV secretory system conjugative DNA transfer family protein [Bacillus sp. FJAT-22090]